MAVCATLRQSQFHACAAQPIPVRERWVDSTSAKPASTCSYKPASKCQRQRTRRRSLQTVLCAVHGLLAACGSRPLPVVAGQRPVDAASKQALARRDQSSLAEAGCTRDACLQLSISRSSWLPAGSGPTPLAPSAASLQGLLGLARRGN